MTNLEKFIQTGKEKCDAATEIVCKIHSSGGREGIHMSIPPQETDSDMLLIDVTYKRLPAALAIIEVYEEAFSEMEAHLCDSRSDGNPCSQMWYQDCIQGARDRANKIAGGE